MAEIKLSQLPQATTLTNEDIILLEQDNITKTVKFGSIKNLSDFTNYYNKTQSDSNYYKKTEVDSRLAGINTIKVQAFEPSGAKNGDIWIDVNINVLKYRWNNMWIQLGAVYN